MAKKLDPSETAVVFIEFQNEFVSEGGKLHDAVKGVMESTGTLANAKQTLHAARDKGLLVAHAPISHFQRATRSSPRSHTASWAM